MRFKFVPLEDRIVFDAALMGSLLSGSEEAAYADRGPQFDRLDNIDVNIQSILAANPPIEPTRSLPPPGMQNTGYNTSGTGFGTGTNPSGASSSSSYMLSPSSPSSYSPSSSNSGGPSSFHDYTSPGDLLSQGEALSEMSAPEATNLAAAALSMSDVSGEGSSASAE